MKDVAAALIPYFTGGLFVVAIMAYFSSNMETHVALSIESVKESIEHIKENQVRMEKRIDILDLKIDQLLIHKNKQTQLK